MCCLTIGSIADNPEMFLEPISPFRLKSEMLYLKEFSKIDHFETYQKRMLAKEQ